MATELEIHPVAATGGVWSPAQIPWCPKVTTTVGYWTPDTGPSPSGRASAESRNQAHRA